MPLADSLSFPFARPLVHAATAWVVLVLAGCGGNTDTDGSSSVPKIGATRSALALAARCQQAAAPLGAHTREVLMQDLDLDDESFSELVSSGVVG